MPESISREHARRLCLRAGGLDSSWRPPEGAAGVADVVERLGYVQIDAIAVVERAHHHTLWMRLPGYDAEHLHTAQAVDRSIFEAWYPAASYVPMAHYRYALPGMGATADWYVENWRVVDQEVLAVVRSRLRDEGALASAEFEAPEGHRRAGWWDWKPAKRVLEQLLATGEVMVSERRGFQRVYDLRERVLPPGTDTRYPTDEEQALFLAERALMGQGIAGVGNSRWRKGRRALLGRGLALMEEKGQAVRLEIEGIDRGRWYARPGDLDRLDDAAPARDIVRPLSPFDPTILNRAWLKALWGFDYSIECYLPAAKRKYGYFTLPLLWSGEFIGRVDAKAERAAGTLTIRGLFLEEGVTLDDELSAALSRGLQEFAAFNGCARVEGLAG